MCPPWIGILIDKKEKGRRSPVNGFLRLFLTKIILAADKLIRLIAD